MTCSRVRLFDVGAARGLPGNHIPRWHSPDDPDLAVAFHPEALSSCGETGFVDSAAWSRGACRERVPCWPSSPKLYRSSVQAVDQAY